MKTTIHFSQKCQTDTTLNIVISFLFATNKLNEEPFIQMCNTEYVIQSRLESVFRVLHTLLTVSHYWCEFRLVLTKTY